MSLCSSVVPSPAAHPRILINTTIPEELSTEECTHHLYLSLPPLIFFDKFEEFFAVKHNFTLYSPSPDLELPAHALTSQDDTSLVIHLAPGTLDSNGQRLEVPLHIRYAQPRAGGGYQHLTLSWPTLFSICKRTSEGQRTSRISLPCYESLPEPQHPTSRLYLQLFNVPWIQNPVWCTVTHRVRVEALIRCILSEHL